MFAEPPLGSYRYRVAYGGRGSTKSWTIGRMLLVHGVEHVLRVLCAREYQTSIRDSVHKLLSDQVDALGLADYYDVQRDGIHGANGTEFFFKGLHHNAREIKSTEGIDLCWVEEAESVSDESWQLLIPTVRKPGSEIWVSFNPQLESDPTYQRFVVQPPARSVVRRVSYRDNPWLPDVLREEAEQLLARDPEAHAHVWGGETWQRTKDAIFAHKCVRQEFAPSDGWQGPYFGADFGFAADPSVLVKCWIADRRLWIEYAESGVQLGMDDLARLYDRVPRSREYTIRADSARPETIHEMQRRGFRIESAPKWDGSIKDGIEHLRGQYDAIVIHPRAELAWDESHRYRWKTDPRTGDILPTPIDKYNHGWDAIRYALSPLIRQRQFASVRVRYA